MRRICRVRGGVDHDLEVSHIFSEKRPHKSATHTHFNHSVNTMSEEHCVICLEEQKEMVKCGRCEGWVCLDCNSKLDECPYCREQWTPPAAEAEALNLGELNADLMEQHDAEEDIPPPLEAPAYVRDEFKSDAISIGFDDAGWWFDNLQLDMVTRLPWLVFEEFTGVLVDGAFRATHSAWAIKKSYGFVDEPAERIEVVEVKLFHWYQVEREWSIERVIYE